MKKTIPAPVIAVMAEYMPKIETHAGLDNLFLYADAPGDPPEGSKPVKTQAWLRRINKENDNPLAVLGKLIESYMEIPNENDDNPFGGSTTISLEKEFQQKLISVIEGCNLSYISGGYILMVAQHQVNLFRILLKEEIFQLLKLNLIEQFKILIQNPERLYLLLVIF
ncbi:MAG: hypothetical protein U5L07_00870 [Desulfobacterales bacterium]|nr:hypothetical protein [Desulfobacterales bacterium]